MTTTEFGSIEREIHVDASPDIVFEVVSKPEHLAQWWTDDARFETRAGAAGELVWGDGAQVVPITVVDVDPPRLFSFRWCAPEGEAADEGNSLLVRFELTAVDGGTRIRLVETGFREMGWEAAKLEAEYLDHSNGWTKFVPDLGTYVTGLVAAK